MTAAEQGLSAIKFTLNGETVTAYPHETILQAARRHGVDIPHLCYKDGLRPDGNCRACVVEIEGERVLAPSCCRQPTADMKVQTNNERALKSQKLVLELLRSDRPAQSPSPTSELDHWYQTLNMPAPRFARTQQRENDDSHPAIAVNMDDCIVCGRCVRACQESQVHDVIGLAFRGAEARIVFDLQDGMGLSSCVSCGECVQACPTGALLPKTLLPEAVADKKVDSLCPYCGVGCQISYHVKDDRIVYADGRDGPANHGRLCVKGRYGFDYVRHPQRLTKPLIRREGVSKSAGLNFDPNRVNEVFREATWEEALDAAANGLKKLRDTHGSNSLTGFGSAKGSNEEAYLFQKLVRTGFGTNNVDHCTRLCHASSVAALLEGIGSGAVSNPVADVQYAEVFIIIGSNPTVNHPVAATFMKNAIENGSKLILMDPRQTEMARHAEHFLQFNPDTDVALLNAMMHVIVTEGLTNDEFIAERTEGFEALKTHLQAFSPELMAPICGIDAETIRTVSRLYATAKTAMILWGMGVSQHIHGTDNARCLIALALMTGQIGRRGTGLHPLRGQNNVQGASDVGLIPMMYPDYQRVDNPEIQAKFEQAWGCKLDSTPGLTVVEIMDAIHEDKIKGMYVMGENPAMSDPDVEHARQALCHLEHLVVQDIFLTETACLADVVLPASAFAEKLGTFTNTDRCVQMARPVVSLVGDAHQDLWIIQDIARRIGLDWQYANVSDVFNEMRQVMPSIAGITWERLEADSAVTYPCEQEGDPGDEVIFVDDFPTANGLGKFIPASLIKADELPDNDYGYVLITGRLLEHWHTGSMTRRAGVLDTIEPIAEVSMNPADMEKLGLNAGDCVTIHSRRGSITLYVRNDRTMPVGVVFVPFCFYEAAANVLTNPALDPFGKIPEFKYCAVKIEKGGDNPDLLSFGGGKIQQDNNGQTKAA